MSLLPLCRVPACWQPPHSVTHLSSRESWALESPCLCPASRRLHLSTLAGSTALLLYLGTLCCSSNATTLLQVAALPTLWLLRVRSVALQACRHQLMQQHLCGAASSLAGQLRQLLGIDLQQAAAVVLVQL